MVNLEVESVEPQRTFYLLSLMLLISLIFLSPDKILQVLAPVQAESEILERTHEMAKILKRLVPGLG